MKVLVLTWWGGGMCAVPAEDVSAKTVHAHPDGGATVNGKYGSARVREGRDVVLARLGRPS